MGGGRDETVRVRGRDIGGENGLLSLTTYRQLTSQTQRKLVRSAFNLEHYPFVSGFVTFFHSPS